MSGEATFRGNQCSVVGVGAAGVKRLADQVLADLGAVGVGGVDEVDAQFDCPAQHGDRRVVVGGVSPDARAGDAHGTETEPVNGHRVRAGGGEGERSRGLDHGGRHGAIQHGARMGEWAALREERPGAGRPT